MTIGQTTWAEFLSQPDAWGRLVERLGGGEALAFDIAAFDEVVLFGSGSSYYLALAVADWMRRRGLPARAVPSCEVLLDPAETRLGGQRLAIGFSRSGTSTEVLLAGDRLKAAGFTVAGVSCTEGSALLEAADHPILVPEGREEGLVMLRSFTSMLVALQWLTGDAADRAALATLPAAGRALLDRIEGPVGDLAGARDFDRFVFLASGPDFPLAREAALKIQEMAIATSEAYHSLEYRHGPKACATERTLVCILSLSDRAHGLPLARDMGDLGTAVMVTGTDAAVYGEVADLAVPLPRDLTQSQGAALAMLPMQLFAYRTAIRLGRDPDAPQNLTKVVTF